MFLSWKKYLISSVYGEHEVTNELELDPVACAGRIRAHTFARVALLFVQTAIIFISSPEEFRRQLIGEIEVNYGCRVSEKYQHRASSLVEYKLIAPSRAGCIKYLNGYFEVVKEKSSGERCARAILNGKKLSEKLKRPEPVNLPEIPDVLMLLADLHDSVQDRNRKGGPRYPAMITADFRHFFHQIAIHPEIGEYCGVRFGEAFFRWRNLPMGLSHSPRVAQCLGWGMLLGTRETPPSLRMAKKALEDAANPPAYVYLQNQSQECVGLLFLWYDNITCLSYDNAVTREILSLFTNMKNEFNVEFKEINHFPASTASIDLADRGWTCLGFQLGIRRKQLKRDRNDVTIGGQTELVWRHDPDKLYRWKRVIAGLECKDEHLPSRRDVARALGLLCWHGYLYHIPLCSMSDSLDHMRTNAPKSFAEWDTPTSLTSADVLEISNQLVSIVALQEASGGWTTRFQTAPSTTVRGASDASDFSGGWVVFNEDGSIHGVPRKFDWNRGLRPAHIFLKEMAAAVTLIEHLAMLHPGKRIQICCDNTGVVGAIRRMYSVNRAANEMLKRIAKIMRSQRVEVVGIRGIDNVADCPSRGVAICPKRLKATWQCLADADRGIRMKPVTIRNDQPGLRHSDEGIPEPLVDIAQGLTAEASIPVFSDPEAWADSVSIV